MRLIQHIVFASCGLMAACLNRALNSGVAGWLAAESIDRVSMLDQCMITGKEYAIPLAPG